MIRAAICQDLKGLEDCDIPYLSIAFFAYKLFIMHFTSKYPVGNLFVVDQ